MLIALISLLVILLVFRVIIAGIRRFISWLGHGTSVYHMVGEDMPVEAQYAAQIRAYVTQAEKIRHEHGIIASLRTGQKHLTREQRDAIQHSVDRARDAYLSYMKLKPYQLVIIFLVGSVAGLILEEIWMFITAGLTQSRVGLVWGPFSPLYGFGAVLLTIICWELRHRNASSMTIFFVSVLVGGSLEQLTGWGMETFFHASSWTYIYLPDHITQWVAWRFLFFWGMLGLAWTRIIMPDLLYRIGMATTKRQVIFVALLTIYLVADIFMTVICFGRKTARDEGIPAQNAFENWVDANYTDEFIAARFQNLTIAQGSHHG
ncbi:putative ABC transporter permease [Atopobium fossor]|uniref:putative ABC transporter permease n=1 Tax=Atopobium fossor TaxID=39487 RepID=UPI00040190FE|nr:putative ABC transporter permease [Atopobium fossor]